MFARKERFPRALFATALSRGKRFSTPNLTGVVPAEGKGYAIVIPKKIAPLSADRHRIKRRVAAAIAKMPSLPRALLIFPKSAIKGMPFKQVQEEVGLLLSKISR